MILLVCQNNINYRTTTTDRQISCQKKDQKSHVFNVFLIDRRKGTLCTVAIRVESTHAATECSLIIESDVLFQGVERPQNEESLIIMYFIAFTSKHLATIVLKYKIMLK